MHGETIDLIDTKSLALFFLLDRRFFFASLCHGGTNASLELPVGEAPYVLARNI
jgi:hypothetical protein